MKTRVIQRLAKIADIWFSLNTTGKWVSRIFFGVLQMRIIVMGSSQRRIFMTPISIQPLLNTAKLNHPEWYSTSSVPGSLNPQRGTLATAEATSTHLCSFARMSRSAFGCPSFSFNPGLKLGVQRPNNLVPRA